MVCHQNMHIHVVIYQRFRNFVILMLKEFQVVSLFHGDKEVMEHLFYICGDSNSFLSESKKIPQRLL